MTSINYLRLGVVYSVVVFPDRAVKPVPALLIFYIFYVSNVSVTLHLACTVCHRGYWIALFDHYSLPGDSENPSLIERICVLFFFFFHILFSERQVYFRLFVGNTRAIS